MPRGRGRSPHRRHRRHFHPQLPGITRWTARHRPRHRWGRWSVAGLSGPMGEAFEQPARPVWPVWKWERRPGVLGESARPVQRALRLRVAPPMMLGDEVAWARVHVHWERHPPPPFAKVHPPDHRGWIRPWFASLSVPVSAVICYRPGPVNVALSTRPAHFACFIMPDKLLPVAGAFLSIFIGAGVIIVPRRNGPSAGRLLFWFNRSQGNAMNQNHIRHRPLIPQGRFETPVRWLWKKAAAKQVFGKTPWMKTGPKTRTEQGLPRSF